MPLSSTVSHSAQVFSLLYFYSLINQNSYSSEVAILCLFWVLWDQGGDGLDIQQVWHLSKYAYPSQTSDSM